MSHRTHALRSILAAALAAGACSDSTTSPARASISPTLSAASVSGAGTSTVAWNQTARELIVARAATSPIVQVRILTYLSVAQYNALIGAEDAKHGNDRPSPAAAIAGASVVVLKSFFPLDATLLEGKLLAQETDAPWPGEHKTDFDDGEAIGRAIGVLVNAYAATDNFNLTVPPPNPGGPGNWTGVNSIRGLFGTRTFALTSGSQFRPGPPPAFGSPAFLAALAEVRAYSDGLTPAQLAIAVKWAGQGPAFMNSVASGMIVDHNRSEREAARLMALANMAGFDVSNACFDAKFAYWFIRPSQADPLIKLPVGLPNHPSYTSGHSCITAAYATVLADEFPQESTRLEAMTEEAGLARIYGGLHYTFDLLAGRELGRQVAYSVRLVLGNKKVAIPLD